MRVKISFREAGWTCKRKEWRRVARGGKWGGIEMKWPKQGQRFCGYSGAVTVSKADDTFGLTSAH